jgi:energy-converting hydrogenase Eha subunit F
MSGVFQYIDSPPPHHPASLYPPPPPSSACGAGDTLAGWKGGGAIFRKTPDTALYSTYGFSK